jgi:hypothetical protein
MFHAYHQVLVLGQHHLSCLFFGDLGGIVRPVVIYDGLDARLVVQVRDTLLTGVGGHHIRPGLISLLASVEILHKDTIISSHYFKNIQ